MHDNFCRCRHCKPPLPTLEADTRTFDRLAVAAALGYSLLVVMVARAALGG